MASSSTQDTPPFEGSKRTALDREDNGREVMPPRAKREKVNQDRIVRPLRKLVPKCPSIQNGKDPREGALAEEIRRMSAKEERAMDAELSRVSGTHTVAVAIPVIVETPATDSSLDGEYSTDEEYMNNIKNEECWPYDSSTHNAAAEPVGIIEISSQLRHGHLLLSKASSPPLTITGFEPAVTATQAAEWSENHEYHNADVSIPSKSIEQRNTAVRSLVQASSSAQVPLPPLLQPRRSPRRHVRRGVTEPPKRRRPARRNPLPAPNPTENITNTGEAPENTLAQGEGTITQIAGPASNCRPIKIIIKFNRGPIDVLSMVGKGGQLDPEGVGDSFRPQGAVDTIKGGITTKAVQGLGNPTIDPTPLVKHLNPDREDVSWNRQVDLWYSRLFGNITTDGPGAPNGFNPTDPINPYQPLFLGGRSRAGVKASTGQDIIWDHNAPDGQSAETSNGEGLEDIAQVFKENRDRNQAVNSGYNQNAIDYSHNRCLVASASTGMPILYDWTLYGHGSEDIGLPEPGAFGYYLVENDSQGVPVRRFYPYTEDDWNNATYEAGLPMFEPTFDL